MGRAKVMPELIQSRKSRNLIFKNRKNGLKKKVHELSTLCGVKAALIIYGPKQDDQPHQLPEIWPENHDNVLELINTYKRKDCIKRTFDLSDFLEDGKKKVKVVLEETPSHEVAGDKYPTWDVEFDDFAEGQLREFGRFLEGKLEAAKAKLETMKNNKNNNLSGLQDYAYDYLRQERSTSMKSMEGFKVNENLSNFDLIPCNYQQLQQGISFGSTLFKDDQWDGYNDPMMSGLVESMSHVNNLIMAPQLDPMQQALPDYHMPAPPQLVASQLQMDDQCYFEYGNFGLNNYN